MEEIVVSPLVLDKLNDLVDVLYEKEYFGFRESAVNYVIAISDFFNTIPGQRANPTRRKKYGAWYCRYKPNRNTTWYVTFDTDGELYVVRNIINNHTRDYPSFIKGL